MTQKRLRGGSTGGMEERNRGGRLSGPKIRDKVMSEAKKTSSGGFKHGGAITGASAAPASPAKRARGGRTSAPWSSANGTGKERGARSESGHEGE